MTHPGNTNTKADKFIQNLSVWLSSNLGSDSYIEIDIHIRTDSLKKTTNNSIHGDIDKLIR